MNIEKLRSIIFDNFSLLLGSFARFLDSFLESLRPDERDEFGRFETCTIDSLSQCAVEIRVEERICTFEFAFSQFADSETETTKCSDVLLITRIQVLLIFVLENGKWKRISRVTSLDGERLNIPLRHCQNRGMKVQAYAPSRRLGLYRSHLEKQKCDLHQRRQRYEQLD